jgi:hypothetical protein
MALHGQRISMHDGTTARHSAATECAPERRASGPPTATNCLSSLQKRFSSRVAKTSVHFSPGDEAQAPPQNKAEERLQLLVTCTLC